VTSARLLRIKVKRARSLSFDFAEIAKRVLAVGEGALGRVAYMCGTPRSGVTGE